MTWILRWALPLLIAAHVVFTPVRAAAAPTPTNGAAPAAVAEVTLNGLREQLEQIPVTVDNDDDIKRLTAVVNAITAQTDKFVTTRTGQLADLNARLGELGPAPAAGSASTEDPDVTRQRTALLKQRNAIDADIRLARLFAVDAQQRRSDMLAQRRAAMEAELFGRADSPLGEDFWQEADTHWTEDRLQLKALSAEVRTGLSTAFDPARRFGTLTGLAAALGLLVAGIWMIESLLTWVAARKFPVGRLRRSLLALLTVLVDILIVTLAAALAWQALESHGEWGERSRKLADATLNICTFLAFVIGLGRALLSNRRPSWRLPPVPDPVAARLTPVPWLVALTSFVAWVPLTLSALTGGPLNAVTTNLAPALMFVVMLAIMLWCLRTPRRASAPATTDESAAVAERPLWMGLLGGLLALVALAAVVLIALGYLALARTVAMQATWTGIVLACAYLLFKLADDLCMAFISSRSALGQRLQNAFDFAPQTLDQVAVLLSAISRVAVFFYMAIALIAPLASGPGELLQRGSKLTSGLKVGEFELVPGAILSALVVLVIGFAVLRITKRWLENTFLPNTTLETGMRSSLTTLLGYAGGIVVVALGLSALGIGVNRIAWVASALSVGIGFGLQAIVQNFISGLILLAERPVKVGDWVVLGSTEGDVRRINVRATEIQLADRSTLIVPNSEFITKTVRNMTLANAEGRVLIRLPMPLTTDTQKVRDIMLGACSAHESVLDTPSPGVTLDGVENALLVFQAIAYVPSPRMASSVRSDLLFTIFQRLQAEGVPMAAYALPLTPAPTPVAAAPSS